MGTLKEELAKRIRDVNQEIPDITNQTNIEDNSITQFLPNLEELECSDEDDMEIILNAKIDSSLKSSFEASAAEFESIVSNANDVTLQQESTSEALIAAIEGAF